MCFKIYFLTFKTRLTHVMPLVSFNTPWKFKKIYRFSDVCSGYRERPEVWNGLRYIKTKLHLVFFWRNTCQRVLRAYVLACQRASRAYVLTCPRALRAYVLKCQRALRAHVPTCLACLRPQVPCVLTCSCANVPCVPKCWRAITSNNKNKFSMTWFT